MKKILVITALLAGIAAAATYVILKSEKVKAILAKKHGGDDETDPCEICENETCEGCDLLEDDDECEECEECECCDECETAEDAEETDDAE